MISDASGGRTQAGVVQGGEGAGSAVIAGAAPPFRGSLGAAGSRKGEGLKCDSLRAKQSMDEGSSRMKPKGAARKKIEEKEMFLQNKPFW